MPGYQHQHQANGIKQPSGSIQYLPRSQVEDMTSEETHKDANSAAPTPSSMDDQQPQTKEIEKIIFDTGIQEFILKHTIAIPTGDITNDLAYKLEGLVTLIGKSTVRYLQIGSHITERYLSVKLSDEQSKNYLLNLAFNEPTKTTTLGANSLGSEKALDNGDKDLETPTERQPNQCDSSSTPTTKSLRTEAKIEGPFNPKGKVEHIRLYPNKYGGLLTSTVTLANDSQVKDLQRRQQTVVFIGTDSGRITRLGNDDITFQNDLRELEDIEFLILQHSIDNDDEAEEEDDEGVN
ncbi:hypothetical protein BGX30_004595 [Mortierella sp. GBA39]|nr:hypothetical protein BGX30_004595 [Mortierella sp. GBA39]